MSYDFNLSFHEGDNFSLEHDNREFVSPNVQPDKSSQNIVYDSNVDLIDFYDRTFQKAYEEHIERQIKGGHGNRVKDWPKTYYEYIYLQQQEQEKIKQQMRLEKAHFKEIHQEDKYQRIAKQIIVQVGNIDDFENLSPEEQQELHNKMKNALKEYMDTFQKENPNFIIVNAVIHVDEMSLSPHLHLTYVPVAVMKRGQRVQNSLNSSLKAMGFETDKTKDEDGIWLTAQMKWQAKERERMVEIAKKHGLSIGYQKGNRTQSRTIDEYRKARQEERIAEATEKVEQLEKKAVETEAIIAQKEQEVGERLEVMNQQVEEIEERLADAEQQVNLLDDMKNNIKQTIDKAEREFSSALVVEEPPTAPYETKEVGFGKKRQRFVMVPEEDFDAMRKQDFFNPDSMKRKVSHLFDELRTAFSSLPAIPKLQKKIAELGEKVRYWQNKCEQAQGQLQAKERTWQREKSELQAEVEKGRKANQGLLKALENIGNRVGKHIVNEELAKLTSKDKQDRSKQHRRDDHDDDPLGR